jgi:hypothetical protein
MARYAIHGIFSAVGKKPQGPAADESCALHCGHGRQLSRAAIRLSPQGRAAPQLTPCPAAPTHRVPCRRAYTGTIGHVAHGKSTVVKAISGVQTVRFKNELERNITIKLGYANAKIFKCSNAACERPSCYRAYGSSKEVSSRANMDGPSPQTLHTHSVPPRSSLTCVWLAYVLQDNPPCELCGSAMDLVRHVSFVDCPGHDILMATMLNGAAVMVRPQPGARPSEPAAAQSQRSWLGCADERSCRSV